MRKNDSSLNLIKSIKPIDYSYSKQGQNYEKFFSSLSLKNLLKNANKKVKVSKKYELPILQEQKKASTDLVNIKINSSFNYVTELSSLKNFQVSSMKKKKITEEDIEKMKLFKELFYITKEKIVDLDFRKKRFQRIKDKYIEQKSYGVKEVTLDPGKYFPKYNILYKRNPVVFFGTKGLNDKNDKLKIKISDNNKDSLRQLNKTHSADNLNIKRYKNISEQVKKRKDKNKNDNIIKKLDNTKNMNIVPLPKTVYNSNKYTTSNDFLKIEKINSFNISKKLTSSSGFNKTTTRRRLLKKSSSVSDYDKIKCPIVFNKMPGRDRKIVITSKYKEADYTPKYDITRPHVPATIFKHSFDYSKFKKFITGKIIRSYCYTPDKYFILEINKNMESNNNPNSKNKKRKDYNIINYN